MKAWRAETKLTIPEQLPPQVLPQSHLQLLKPTPPLQRTPTPCLAGIIVVYDNFSGLHKLLNMNNEH